MKVTTAAGGIHDAWSARHILGPFPTRAIAGQQVPRSPGWPRKPPRPPTACTSARVVLMSPQSAHRDARGCERADTAGTSGAPRTAMRRHARLRYSTRSVDGGDELDHGGSQTCNFQKMTPLPPSSSEPMES
jgi:hypothetical protein